MRLCVFGAGAVGSCLAARLLEAGQHEISIVARGAQLEAISAHGLMLLLDDREITVRPDAITGDSRELPAQDVVFVTTKAHSQPAAAGHIGALLGSRGTAVFMCNGIPWWWNYRGDRNFASNLPLIDPESSLWRRVRPERTVGCVVYSANEFVRPGVVRHTANNRWLLGEPDGCRSHRLAAIQGLMVHAELDTQMVDDLRREIWIKLLRNVPLNSICALTRLAVDELAFDRNLIAVSHAVVDEIAAIAERCGADVWDCVETAKAAPRLGGAIDARTQDKIRPSMLQDVMHGRRLELEPILGQVQAFAQEAGERCPTLDLLLSLLRGLDRASIQLNP